MPFGITFFCCLLINIEFGILVGSLIHLLLLVHEATRTKSTYVRYKVYIVKASRKSSSNVRHYQNQGESEHIVFRVDRNLYFPSVERLRQALSRVVSSENSDSLPRTISIDMGSVTQVDHTTLKV